MSTRMYTGLSKGKDTKTTATEAVSQALDALGDTRPDLALLYCSSTYDYNTAVKTIRALTGNVPLIGSSTAGEFTQSRVETGSIAVCLFVSDDIRFFTGIAQGMDTDAETAVGNIIANIPLDDPNYPHRCVFLLSDGMAGNGEEITLLIANMAGPNTQMVGGLAGDDFKMEKTVVFHNDTVADKSASICVMASKKPFYTSVNHGHCALTGPMKVTRAKENVLYEVDGCPTWEIWKEMTREAATKLDIDVDAIESPSEVAEFLANFELGLKTGSGSYKVRYPMSKNQDGSLNFTCTIPHGATICIMDGHDEQQQIDAARRSAEQVKQAAQADGYSTFAGALVVECAVRQFLLGDRFHEAPAAMCDVLNGIPMIGAETYGEMRLEPGQFSGYHNTTTVSLLFPDS